MNLSAVIGLTSQLRKVSEVFEFQGMVLESRAKAPRPEGQWKDLVIGIMRIMKLRLNRFLVHAGI